MGWLVGKHFFGHNNKHFLVTATNCLLAISRVYPSSRLSRCFTAGLFPNGYGVAGSGITNTRINSGSVRTKFFIREEIFRCRRPDWIFLVITGSSGYSTHTVRSKVTAQDIMLLCLHGHIWLDVSAATSGGNSILPHLVATTSGMNYLSHQQDRNSLSGLESKTLKSPNPEKYFFFFWLSMLTTFSWMFCSLINFEAGLLLQ